MLLADRERRLRLRIDQLSDELDEARQGLQAAEGQLELLAEAENRIIELKQTKEMEKRDRQIVDLRLRSKHNKDRLREAKKSRDLWKKRAQDLSKILSEKQHVLTVIEREFNGGGPYHGRPGRKAFGGNA